MEYDIYFFARGKMKDDLVFILTKKLPCLLGEEVF
jgi:hypothetical protein